MRDNENTRLYKNTRSGGAEDTKKSEKSTSHWIHSLHSKPRWWTINFFHFSPVQKPTTLEKVLQNYADKCWILIDDEESIIWIIPRVMKICNRLLRVELE